MSIGEELKKSALGNAPFQTVFRSIKWNGSSSEFPANCSTCICLWNKVKARDPIVRPGCSIVEISNAFEISWLSNPKMARSSGTRIPCFFCFC